MIDTLKPKEVGVWAVVFKGRVIANHIGHPEMYVSPFPDEFNISLVQHSHSRGRAKIGNIWNGEKFIND
jgi:hypothetical protein